MFISIILSTIATDMVLFDFSKDSDLSAWRIVDDGVMGGRSAGQFGVNEDGHAVFKGFVSLENNGGFSSVRYRFNKKEVSDMTSIILRIKGDGKRYQFRVKTSSNDRHSYIYHFETTSKWQTIRIPLVDLKPTFRGRDLDMPNYPGEVMEEISILIANKEAEEFKLEIDKIILD